MRDASGRLSAPRDATNVNDALQTDGGELAPDRDEVVRFLAECIHTGDHQLVAIEPDKGNLIARWFAHDDVDVAANWAVEQNRQYWNLYWTVNVVTKRLGKKAKKTDILAARFFHADIDPPKDGGSLDKEEVRLELLKLPCPPSIIVDSGNGLQPLWCLQNACSKDSERKLVESINRAIEHTLEADACHNIDRVLRLPGTVNWPNAKKRAGGRVPIMANLDYAAPDGNGRYTLEEMQAAFPPRMEATAAPATESDHDVRLGEVGALTPDDLGYEPDSRVRAAIDRPDPKDRSKAGVYAACCMIERSATNEQIAGVLLNPANRVSAHYLDPEKHPDWDSQLRSATRAIATARQKVASDRVLVTADGDKIRLVGNKNGHPVWCAENASLMLEHHPDWAGALAYDEFHHQVLLLKPVPGARTARPVFLERELRDEDVTDALRWFNRHGFSTATRSMLHDAMLAVARQSIISPVRYYLDDLQWDGVLRLEAWLVTYCGAEDTTYTREVGRRWLISAVARAMQPGCKADYCMILEGDQGIGKSTLLRTLASDEWFHDGLRDMTSKDASMALRGRWIIELPELSAMRRSDVEAVKAFLSRSEERYRPPYGRSEVSEPRRCVFAGTTNRTDYLLDDTGARLRTH